MIRAILDKIYLLTLFFVLVIDFFPPLFNINLHIGLSAIMFLYFVFSGFNLKNKSYISWYGIFLLFSLLSFVWSISLKFSIYVYIVYLIPILFTSLATLTYITDISRLSHILKLYLFCCAILLIYLIINEDVQEGVRYGSGLNENLEKAIWNGNAISVQLGYGILIGYIIFMDNLKYRPLYKIIYIACSIVALYIIFLTGSRKGILMLIIPILFFVLKNRGTKFILSIIAMFVLLIVLWILMMKVDTLYNVLGYRMEELLHMLEGTSQKGEDSSRMELINMGIDWWKQKPVMGYGINTYRELSTHTFRFIGRNFYAHNNYIELLVDIGILGLITYYSGFIYLIRKSNKVRSPHTKWVIPCVLMLLFLDFAQVSYYGTIEQLLICILFSTLQLTKHEYAYNRYN